MPENWTVEQLRNKGRKRVRRYGEWLDYLSKLPPNAHQYERDFAYYAMKLIDSVEPPKNELVRLVEASLPAQVENLKVETPNFMPQINGTEQRSMDLDLSELFSSQERVDERSIRHLSSQQPPRNYTPTPTFDQLKTSFEANKYYISSDDIFSIHQAIKFGRPIKVEGKPGTGKTELAKQIAVALGLEMSNPFHFLELFCTPDISKDESIYRWNDARRLIDMELLTGFAQRLDKDQLAKVYVQINSESYSPRYLDLHVLLRACVLKYRTVVLIDEIDKTYPEFDSYLLDIVDKNYFVVPEMGRVGRDKFDPNSSPIFVMTTNHQRELSGPLSRRSKAIFYDYLPENLESKVIQSKTACDLMEAGRIAAFFHHIRTLSLQQAPSTAEVLDTAIALKESNLSVTNRNLFRLRTHWIKNAPDFGVIKKRYFKKNAQSIEEWVEQLT